MQRTAAIYEREEHHHRGLLIGIARHETCAPFACNSPLKIAVEPSQVVPGYEIITERCQCGKVVNVWGVIPAP